jgi:hypothetical protein
VQAFYPQTSTKLSLLKTKALANKSCKSLHLTALGCTFAGHKKNDLLISL